MSQSIDASRSDIIREGLIGFVGQSLRPPRSKRQALSAVGLLTAGLVVGGAVSAAVAAQVVGSQAPSRQSPAPLGTVPGTPIISLLGASASTLVDGSASIEIGEPLVGASHVRVTLTCTSAGTAAWGFDASGNNPGTTCDETDAANSATSSFDFPLEDERTLTISSSDGLQSIITYQFVRFVETDWSVNERGETYGAANEKGSPDLVWVIGLSNSGERTEGFVRNRDLEAFGPDWEGQPTSPEQALEWQEARDLAYPNGWDVDLMKSDGQTVIGTFHIGGP
jgi:hypothetical protein